MFTHKVHPVFSQPVKAFEEKQQSEKGHKARREIIPEDCKGQTGLGHRIPGAFNQMLKTNNIQMRMTKMISFPHFANRYQPPFQQLAAARKTPCALISPKGKPKRKPECIEPAKERVDVSNPRVYRSDIK